MRPVKWAYGIITVPERIQSTLPDSIRTLEQAGFDYPTLFIDGATCGYGTYDRLPKVYRKDRIGVYGNWVLSLYELYIKNPTANYFALFQDDIIACRNIKQYVENTFPTDGYLNLYTFPENEVQRPTPDFTGWYQSPYANGSWVYQTARGAQGIVLHKHAVMDLLSNRSIVDRVQDKHIGWRSIDGAIGIALNNDGWKEYVHYPSLLQHTGLTCTFNKRANATFKETTYKIFEWHPTTLSQSFKGEEFDCLTLPRTNQP